MLARIVQTIERFHMFEPGQRVGVAVSGGADSVCLLSVLRELVPRWDLQLCVLHLDHMLRGEESDGDAKFVRDLADRHHLPFVMRRVQVAAEPDNLEQAARQARLNFFHDSMRSGAIDRVALGHTRSDQAETVLFRLLRGSGSAGLAGIRPVTADGIVRPLLDVDRADVEMYLGERGISWREDSSNRSPEFARNRIRRQLLPQLAAEWNPRIVEVLAQTADWAFQEEEYWNLEIDRLSHLLVTGDGGARVLETGQLMALPAAAARRLVRRAIELVRGDLRGIDFAHVESILSLAGGGEGHGRTQAPGIDAIRSFEWLRISTSGSYPGLDSDYGFSLNVPGQVEIPGSCSRLRAELVDKRETIGSPLYVYNSGMSCLDWDTVSGPLTLRNWRPGDQYYSAGQSSGRKIKDLFQEYRIPLWERRRWPVIVGVDGIVWTRRFGPAARHIAGPATRVVLGIWEERAGSGIGTVVSSV